MADVPRCDHMLFHPPPLLVPSLRRAALSLRSTAAEAGTKRVALTFDDGPSGTSSTESVLDVLDTYGINATFFVVGLMIERNPDKVKSAFDRGHLIENHSRTHPEFSTLGEAQMIEEIDSVTAQIEALGIPTPQYFRPPYGDGDGSTLTNLLADRGLTPVYWTIDSRDWEIPNAETVYANTLRDLRNAWGAGQLTNIVLFHDIQSHTPSVIEMLIPDLVGEGCEFVMVDAVA
jgi:peptidoglycan/xylan/chitin deacetylase (PgdA/CDA1 family)